MKFATFIATFCCLAALTSVAQAQDMFTFDTPPEPTTGDASYIFIKTPQPPNFPIFYAPKTLAADNNPLRLAIFSVSGSAAPAISFQFQNDPNYGTDLSGVYLTNVDDNPNDVLTITFLQPVTSISFDFAIANFTANNIPDATLSLNGVNDMGVYNSTSTNFQGLLTYTGSPFTVANISFTPGASGDNGYSIDNILVDPAATAVPEPGIVVIGAACLFTLAGLLRRRR
jgi:hypothetical protein